RFPSLSDISTSSLAKLKLELLIKTRKKLLVEGECGSDGFPKENGGVQPPRQSRHLPKANISASGNFPINNKQVRTKLSWCPLITRCGGSFSQEKPLGRLTPKAKYFSVREMLNFCYAKAKYALRAS
ncbi:MAG: hypothetical protein IJF21_02080, partial [Clostridia bacterium]|nr:hypothetical protein [Clostridia bacterium]